MALLFDGYIMSIPVVVFSKATIQVDDVIPILL